MAYKEKDTKKWTAQWFETNARGEKKSEEKEVLRQSERLLSMSDRRN